MRGHQKFRSAEFSMDEQVQTRILIAEGRPAVRVAVKMFVQQEPGLEIVGEAADSQELLAQIEAARPDIVILDWDLSKDQMVDLVGAIRQLEYKPSVIVLGVRPESEHAALAAGAHVFVSKSGPPKRLLTAVRAIGLERSYA